MANLDTQGGLRLVRCRPDGFNVYRVASDYATPLGVGDPVVLAGTSGTDPRTGDRSIPNVERAAASGTITGVIVGIVGVTSATAPAIPTKTHIPASTGGLVIVCDDPYALFAVQEDSVGGSISATEAGEFCDLVYADCSSTTGLSTVELDSSNYGTGDNVRVLYSYPSPGNTSGSANSTWVVQINEHTYKGVGTPI